MTSTHQAAQSEADLVERVREPVPDKLQRRFSELVARRKAGRLTALELEELIRLSDQLAYLQAERVGYLAELARLRQRSLPDIMADLEIPVLVPHDLSPHEVDLIRGTSVTSYRSATRQ